MIFQINIIATVDADGTMQTSSVPTEKGKTMTALEYMEKQLQKHSHNLGREIARGAPKEVVENIRWKISYYETAVVALQLAERRNSNG